MINVFVKPMILDLEESQWILSYLNSDTTKPILVSVTDTQETSREVLDIIFGEKE